MTFAPHLPQVLAVGNDADLCGLLHVHLDRAGHALWCVPAPGGLEAALRLASPQLVVLMLPAAPDGSWGPALTAAAAAARAGTRVVMVAPSRDVVEPLAAVAGAERAFARAEVLARPLLVLERAAFAPPPAPPAAGPFSAPIDLTMSPIPFAGAAPRGPAEGAAPADPGRRSRLPPPREVDAGLHAWTKPPPARPAVDLLKLIDEELVDEPASRLQVTRVEVNVSLVSEHNFYVGPTRRLDSGGVFISTAMPPPVGTRVQVRLGLADGRKLDLDGEVTFVRERSALGMRQSSGCGVRLASIPGWALDAIERFMQARPPLLHAP